MINTRFFHLQPVFRRLAPVLALVLTACTVPAAPAPQGAPTQPPAASSTPTTAATANPAATATPAATAAPLPSATAPPATPTPTDLPPSPTPAVSICSPLPGLDRAGLQAAISNPFAPPRPGSDDPHMGVDFAVRDPDYGYALEGAPVHAVLPGRVAGLIPDRFPYGFAVIIETPLDALPPDWPAALNLPAYSLVPTPPPALTCPGPLTVDGDPERPALYLLYAHLQSAPSLQPGDPVACGDMLAPIGQSGNALHPHLHLEARLGPAGARFPVMAHYDSRALPIEMNAYCLWRVSGVFALLDPLLLLERLE